MEALPLEVLSIISSFCIVSVSGVSKDFYRAVDQYYTIKDLDWAALKCMKMLGKTKNTPSIEGKKMLYIKFITPNVSYAMILQFNLKGYDHSSLMSIACGEILKKYCKSYNKNELCNIIQRIDMQPTINRRIIRKLNDFGLISKASRKMNIIVDIYNTYMSMIGKQRRVVLDSCTKGKFCGGCLRLYEWNNLCMCDVPYSDDMRFIFSSYEEIDQLNWFYN